MKGLKRGSSALRIQVSDYVVALKAFQALEKDASEYCSSEVYRVRYPFRERESLKKDQTNFFDLEKEFILLTEL